MLSPPIIFCVTEIFIFCFAHFVNDPQDAELVGTSILATHAGRGMVFSFRVPKELVLVHTI